MSINQPRSPEVYLNLNVRGMGPSATLAINELSQQLAASGISHSTSPRNVGAKAAFVLAFSALYLDPTFEPDRAIPPGKGNSTPGIPRMAATAASVAASVVA